MNNSNLLRSKLVELGVEIKAEAKPKTGLKYNPDNPPKDNTLFKAVWATGRMGYNLSVAKLRELFPTNTAFYSVFSWTTKVVKKVVNDEFVEVEQHRLDATKEDFDKYLLTL